MEHGVMTTVESAGVITSQ